MSGTAIKVLAILLIAVIWGFITYWAGRSALGIWRIVDVDPAVTFRLVRRAALGWVPNPFEGLEKRVKERNDLQVILTPMEGFTFRPQGGEVITQEFRRDRRQYSLTFINGLIIGYTLSLILWRFIAEAET